MHKRDPLIWRKLQKDVEETHQNSCLEEGCVRMIETLKNQGDKNLQKLIKIAEIQARQYKY